MPTLSIYTVSTTFPQEDRTFLNDVRYQLFSLHEIGRSVALLYQILLQLYSFNGLRSFANPTVVVAGLARPAEAISEVAALPPARPWPACARASAKASGQVARNDKRGDPQYDKKRRAQDHR
jgi:hypothetical protein